MSLQVTLGSLSTIIHLSRLLFFGERKMPTRRFHLPRPLPLLCPATPVVFVSFNLCFQPPEHLSFLSAPLSSQPPNTYTHTHTPPTSASILTVNWQLCFSLPPSPFCGGDKGGQCPLAGYVTGCATRRTLWDGPALSAVTTQITSTASHLISTSNSISDN